MRPNFEALKQLLDARGEASRPMVVVGGSGLVVRRVFNALVDPNRLASDLDAFSPYDPRKFSNKFTQGNGVVAAHVRDTATFERILYQLYVYKPVKRELSFSSVQSLVDASTEQQQPNSSAPNVGKRVRERMRAMEHLASTSDIVLLEYEPPSGLTMRCVELLLSTKPIRARFIVVHESITASRDEVLSAHLAGPLRVCVPPLGSSGPNSVDVVHSRRRGLDEISRCVSNVEARGTASEWMAAVAARLARQSQRSGGRKIQKESRLSARR